MNPSPLTLACFAIKEEARPFAQRLLPGSKVKVLVTGMGRANAIRVLSGALKEKQPALVLSCGYAGGLRPDLESGTVIFAATSAPHIEARLLSAGALPVRFHCAEKMIVTKREKRELRETTGSDAVEMESGPICELCKRERIPYAVVRVILDTAGEDLPLDFNQLLTADMRISPIRLAAALTRSPTKMSRLIELRNRSRKAAAQLAEVLLQVIAGDAPRE